MNSSLTLPVGLLLTALIMYQCTQPQPLNYPDTRRDEVVDYYHGVPVADPYRWLEDDRSEETAAWVRAQNEVTFGYLDRISFRDALRERISSIWDHERYGVPFWKNDMFFYFKNDGMQNQSVLYVRDGLDGESRVFLDPNLLSEDGTVSVSQLSISGDGRYMAYSLSRGGSDWNEIFVRDIQSGEDLDDHIQWVKFSGMSWRGNGFYYSRYDEPAPGEELSGSNEFHKIYYHQLGTPQQSDQLIFENPAHPRRNYGASTTDDERFLIVYETRSTSGNAVYVKDMDRQESDFIRIIEGFDYQSSVIDHIDGKMLVRTNLGAPMYRLVLIDPAKPQPTNWTEIIPGRDYLLRGVSLAGGKLLVSYLQDVISRAYQYSLQGKREREITLPGAGTISGFSARPGENLAFFSYASYNYPSTIFKYDVAENAYELYFRPAIDFNPDDYISRQVFYTSRDGTQIPMFITHHKDIVPDGNNPTLLYGYGGFNVSLTPSFSIGRIAWLENGGIYAVPNIRGGGEYGKEWHEAGIQLNRQNVFDDFIAAAEYLIAEGFTSPQKLAIQGGSNGGLLVGAVANQRPDLFKVALPAVGVMDMLRFHKFTIGWAWIGDYGSSEDSLHFRNLYAYSPLHNIQDGIQYPATLVTTADHDDRVVPAHSFKYIAELQYRHRGHHPVLIRIDTQAGHGAGKSTSQAIDELTDVYSFVFHVLGIKPRV